jgi:hypothetical protein
MILIYQPGATGRRFLELKPPLFALRAPTTLQCAIRNLVQIWKDSSDSTRRVAMISAVTSAEICLAFIPAAGPLRLFDWSVSSSN